MKNPFNTFEVYLTPSSTKNFDISSETKDLIIAYFKSCYGYPVLIGRIATEFNVSIPIVTRFCEELCLKNVVQKCSDIQLKKFGLSVISCAYILV